jgi:hypothetical protein
LHIRRRIGNSKHWQFHTKSSAGPHGRDASSPLMNRPNPCL